MIWNIACSLTFLGATLHIIISLESGYVNNVQLYSWMVLLFFWGGGINSIYIADFVKILWRIKWIKRKRQPTVCCVFSIFLSFWHLSDHTDNMLQIVLGLAEEHRVSVCIGDLLWLSWTMGHLDALLCFLKKEKDYDSVQPWPVCLLFCKSKAGGHYMCWVTAQFARRTASIFMIRGIRGWHQHSRCLLLLLHVSIHASIYILTGGIGQNYNFPPNLVDSGYSIFSHFSLHFMVWWSGQRQNWSFFFFLDKQGNQLLRVDIMRDSSYDLMHSTDSFDEWHWEGEYWYLLLILFFFLRPVDPKGLGCN